MICYAFAVADEASRLLSRCTEKEIFSIKTLRCTIANYRHRRVLIVFIGMGLQNAKANTEILIEYFRPKVVILSGYGGALIPQLHIGQIAISANYSSDSVLPFVRLLNGFDFANFFSTDKIITTAVHREQLAHSTQAQIVDMETSAVAAIMETRSTPFLAIRSISDEFNDPLPVDALAAAYDQTTNRITPFRLAFYLTTHLAEIGHFKRFVQNVKYARLSLTNFLEQLTDELPSHW